MSAGSPPPPVPPSPSGSSPYSAALIAAIPRTISNERLTRYLRATTQNIPNALTLYELNVHLCEALYGLLHGIEIATRNSIHATLTASYGTDIWYDYAPLTAHWQGKLRKAKTEAGSGATPGKVIAELTFGFWVELLKHNNHRALWVGKNLHRAFPNARGRNHRYIHDRLKITQRLRNRISHHERVLTSRNTMYTGFDFLTLAELLEIVDWVCPYTADWIRTHFRLAGAQQVLADVRALGFPL